MKIKSKILAFFLSMCLLVPMFSSISHAASGSVSVSSASGNVGSTVTVSATVKCNSGAIGAATVVLTYNSSGLQYVSGSGGTNGGSGSVTYAGYGDGSATSLSFSMKFKILKEGTYSISGSADGYNWDEEQLSMSVGSGSVTGKAETTSNNNTGTTNNNTGNTNNNTGNTNNNNNNTEEPEDDKDSNSKLKSLKVSPGSLSPAFSANTKSYTVTVPEDTTSVTISAAAQSTKAKVSTSGGKDLKLGPNAAKVVVTAEDGSTTVYNLTIMCGEIEKISMNGQELVIDESFAEDTIPSGFVKTEVTYNDREYTGLKHEKNGLLLMALKSDDVESAFYIFKQETQEFYPFVLITIAEGKQIIPLELYETDAFADMTSLTVQGKAIDAWKIDEEFSVINAMTLEGEEILYKYDQVDDTFQRYSEAAPEKVEEVVEEEKEETFLEKYSLYIIIALAVVVVVLLIAMICLLATRKTKHNARRRRMQKKLEKQSKQNNEE